MLFVDIMSISLPLKNPILIFSLILFIILFAPILLNKFKIPHLIGLIIAGAIIGPNGLNLMQRDSSIILFGTVGLLYIMFLAGLEIDLNDFKKNSAKSLVFGLYTFIIPMTLGILGSYYFLRYSIMSSVLLASMFASHTLLAYPIISKLGITKNRAVNITVGGTIITDSLALLVLAAIAGMANGEVDNMFWIKISISVLIFGLAIMLGFPVIGRWFFKRFDDSISQYIFVLAMVFLGAFLAEAAGVEGIIGAFLVGLSLNRLIPATSPLMNRIEFVGNALFIPFFLIGVGMLIDYRIFFKGIETIKVATMMIFIATLAKFLAAWLTQKTFGFTADERNVIFGLSNAQAAATLAAVLVGYNIVLNKEDIAEAATLGITLEPERLLNENVLNGTILMILVTCTIASFYAQKGAQNIALQELSDGENEEDEENQEQILVALDNQEITEELVKLSLIIKSKSNRNRIYALTIIDNMYAADKKDKEARRILNKAVHVASGADTQLTDLLRYDINVVNGIASTVKEQKITDLIVGITEKKGLSTDVISNLNDGILARCNTTTFVYKPVQPLSTIKRHIVFVPDKAEKEIGFPFWMARIWNLASNTGAKLIFYAGTTTKQYINDFFTRQNATFELVEFDDWNDFLIISRDIRNDDNLIFVMSRKDKPSYHPYMGKLFGYLNKYFNNVSYILIYPVQYSVLEQVNADLKNPSVPESIESLDNLGRSIAKLFKKRD